MACIERSLAIYHTTGATTAGTAVTVSDPEALGNIWHIVTVVNDSTEDIKFKYKTTAGYNGEFIVPKSIKGFTKALKGGIAFDNTTIEVQSVAVGNATGNITINFGV